MRRLTVIAALLAALTVSACGGHEAATGRAGDIAFAQDMIPHHEQALEMSALALAADASPEVTALAKEIQAAQDPEIVLMRSWLRDWGAEELPHSGGPGEESDGHEHEMAGMATGEQLLALAEARGAEFDALWIDLMVAHHEGAIEMAEQVAQTTDDLEVAGAGRGDHRDPGGRRSTSCGGCRAADTPLPTRRKRCHWGETHVTFTSSQAPSWGVAQITTRTRSNGHNGRFVRPLFGYPTGPMSLRCLEFSPDGSLPRLSGEVALRDAPAVAAAGSRATGNVRA